MANRFVALLCFVPFVLFQSNSCRNNEQLLLEELLPSVDQTSGTASSTDVPSWSIGDKWTYETQFDVSQLIAQANVSASLNTLTGDTVYEIDDIFFINVDGVLTLAYKMLIEGDFSSGNSGATLETVMDVLTSIILAKTLFVFEILQSSIRNLNWTLTLHHSILASYLKTRHNLVRHVLRPTKGKIRFSNEDGRSMVHAIYVGHQCKRFIRLF